MSMGCCWLALLVVSQGGQTVDNTLLPTGQLVRPAGDEATFSGRPVDLVLFDKWLIAKDNRGLVILDRASFKVVQELAFPKGKGGGSMHGLVAYLDKVKASGRVWASTSGNSIAEAEVDAKGVWAWKRTIDLAGPGGKGASYPTGLAVDGEAKRLWVCLSMNNSLAEVDLETGKLVREIPVGIAPHSVVLTPSLAFVSNWGGRRPRGLDRTALSAGSQVVIDERGVGASGTVGKVDLKRGRMIGETEVGLHPAGLVLDRGRLFVACANSDTVVQLNPDTFEVVERLVVRPDPALPFGSATNALAISPDGKTLVAANGGNNALGLIALGDKMSLRGFIPTGWYPGAVVADAEQVWVANVKGRGSRTLNPKAVGRSVYDYTGSVTRVKWPDEATLKKYTAQVRDDGRIPQILAARERGEKSVKPVPVPARVGEPSVFEHVVYVIKENRTYDQMFGDIQKGKGEPKLCLFPAAITPNHHALAEQFVLLDNFYCNGVLSADGHAWSTEGNVTDYLEKAFGGFTRSYTFGDDALSYSSTGFIWDGVLLAGRSFRNYGELRYSEPPAKARFIDIWKDYKSGANKIRFTHKLGIASLDRYTAPDYPGWDMKISDQQRIDVWLKEFREAEKKGVWYDFSIVYLPQDHCSGTTPDMPTPNAHMADNDLALGRMVEAISNSKFWPKTVIFVIEDDPQNGFDHIDGHRSICLVISPYTKRREVVSNFYNQTSVLHTMQRILGVPAMNQFDSSSPLMTECFTRKPDFTPYKALPVKTPLDELNPPMKNLKGAARRWAERSLAQDLTVPDRVEEDTWNRILWYAQKGEAAYPAHLVGAHGSGLKARGLRLDRDRIVED
ncbi:MAG: bifunctional YncE family protein/alkaline phosphatase family protein [Gemmataceae bacterium]